MPFFLISHTSLEEADNPEQAAHLAVDRIRSGAAIKVLVKLDEDASQIITVEAHHLTQSEAPTANETHRCAGMATDLRPSPQSTASSPVIAAPRQRISRPVLALAATTTIVAVPVVLWMLST
jgi:hypothetical protein